MPPYLSLGAGVHFFRIVSQHPDRAGSCGFNLGYVIK